MNGLDYWHDDMELENGVGCKGCVENGFEKEPETIVIQEAVKVLLQGLGEDFNREGLKKTPLRVAKALIEGTRGYKLQVKDIISGALFPETGLECKVGQAGGTGGLVIVRDLDLFSYCETCLLPFQVKCHVGYIPSGQRVVGLSKLSRVSEVFAKRLQDPQRLADEICFALQNSFRPNGVAVILQCTHIHFPNFGSDIFGATCEGHVKTVVRSGSGAFDDDMADTWTDFLGLLRFRGINAKDVRSSCKSWCPSLVFCKNGPSNLDMVRSVNLIISSLGEDPSREGLVGTAARFVRWLMNFRNADLDLRLNNNGYSLIQTEEKTKTLCFEMNLPFCSQCEHHLLPFHGVVHVGYYGPNPMGKSLLQSVVHFYGFKLQVQERLTRQIAETASSFLGEDVMVVVEASHTCMISRGIEKFGSNTATIAVLGRFSTDAPERAKFLQIITNSCSGGC
ncbi:GTP cyclohydrolase I [Striga asiatica]|uniref:GTP cyclohydrolase 1 n=1 Tax=Striga asiatica TaxID=4170 RepID=A0A5A7R9Y9_STRAF|nr:GTP cyclohydrolase I [Striga asiatica]